MSQHHTLKIIEKITQALGSVVALVAANILVFGWLGFGLVANMLVDDKYQLLINTTTTCITFIMVFAIQNSQNRDGQAVQAKLDELIRAIEHADDKALVGIEDLPEREIRKIKRSRSTAE